LGEIVEASAETAFGPEQSVVAEGELHQGANARDIDHASGLVDAREVDAGDFSVAHDEAGDAVGDFGGDHAGNAAARVVGDQGEAL